MVCYSVQLPDATVAYDGPPGGIERGDGTLLPGKVAGSAFGGQHELIEGKMEQIRFVFYRFV